ncbi:catechol 2,3-dioxygenase-like lactoylglutathione lyase family enzyme [Amycolatopsis bartoniae]|uniref:Glyoxalase n=1 Tax=Amycolatopsis bartoniae TaxID=941986 RepID=A0A8H9MCF7_9PSEU|nr:VOC family protein [Amycolatopsis bartoniae]MBB2933764.1 catechol 2,3-dioxygenase-like lactoylglutathione lyase family enzyme [Amycolatopsis bartoniae]TVT10574.1 glyoxalase [Amycolatopsis bartoniae]GHF71890.1 glyoxalase [Amycolatopsis bartoniae]
MTLTAVASVAVPVADQDKALAFYVNTLGFEKRRDAMVGNGMRWIEVAPPGAATTVALVAGTGGVDTGIRVASTDAESDHAALRTAGADADEVLNWPGAPVMFVLRDPDGNRLVVVEG